MSYSVIMFGMSEDVLIGYTPILLYMYAYEGGVLIRKIWNCNTIGLST